MVFFTSHDCEGRGCHMGSARGSSHCDVTLPTITSIIVSVDRQAMIPGHVVVTQGYRIQELAKSATNKRSESVSSTWAARSASSHAKYNIISNIKFSQNTHIFQQPCVYMKISEETSSPTVCYLCKFFKFK